MSKPACDYCQQPAQLVTGAVIYPHRPDLRDLSFWSCEPCGAYVGCHKKGARVGGVVSDGTLPLGRLANAELRRAKSEAHAAFDPIWKSGRMRRGKAYRWLANRMGIEVDACHIGMMDVADCRRVAAIAKAEGGKDE